MRGLKCFLFSDKISAYMDGELSSRSAAGIERHLASCDACRKKLEDYRALSGRFNRVLESVPDTVWNKVAAGEKEVRSRTPLFPVFLRPALAFAVLIAVFAGMSVFSRRPAPVVSVAVQLAEPAVENQLEEFMSYAVFHEKTAEDVIDELASDETAMIFSNAVTQDNGTEI